MLNDWERERGVLYRYRVEWCNVMFTMKWCVCVWVRGSEGRHNHTTQTRETQWKWFVDVPNSMKKRAFAFCGCYFKRANKSCFFFLSPLNYFQVSKLSKFQPLFSKTWNCYVHSFFSYFPKLGLFRQLYHFFKDIIFF